MAVRTPSATAFIESMMSCSFSPFPSLIPTVLFRLASPAGLWETSGGPLQS